MVKVSDAFPSKYLKASDLQGQTHRLVISNAYMEDVGDDRRLVLYFQGRQKGLVCNKTNGTKIGDAYGDDTDLWIGRTIEIFPSVTDFQGKEVDCIRVQIPRNDPAQQQPVQPAQHYTSGSEAAAAARETDLSDEVPF